MKKFKGFVVGLSVGVLLCMSTMVFAEDIKEAINVMLNNVNISVNNEVVGKIGENYTLDNGNKVPNTISYKDTTYLPIRKISELLNKDIDWDQDSKTVCIMDKDEVEKDIVDTKKDVSTNDKTKPQISNINSLSSTEVEVVFNEEIDKKTAEEVKNYLITEKYGSKKELTIKEIKLDSTSKKVILTTLDQGMILFNIEISNITDLAGNTMDKYSKAFVGMQSNDSTEQDTSNETFPVKEVNNISNTSVEIIFSQKVEIDQATIVINYKINQKYGNKEEVSITGVNYDVENKKVILTTSQMKGNTLYEVKIENINSVYGHDLSPNNYSFIVE
ncbi:hypothetical protein AN1V17_14880 [Vallitalea sediminicola]